MQPAKPEDVLVALRRLAEHYPIQERTEIGERLRWQDWLNDLAEIPIDIVEAGCDLWRRSPEDFYPTPGQFLIIVEGAAQLRRHMLERLDELHALNAAGVTRVHVDAALDALDTAPSERVRALVGSMTARLHAPRVSVSADAKLKLGPDQPREARFNYDTMREEPGT